MRSIDDIRRDKHQIEDLTINLFQFVSRLHDDDDFDFDERKYLLRARRACIEILAKLEEF